MAADMGHWLLAHLAIAIMGEYLNRNDQSVRGGGVPCQERRKRRFGKPKATRDSAVRTTVLFTIHHANREEASETARGEGEKERKKKLALRRRAGTSLLGIGPSTHQQGRAGQKLSSRATGTWARSPFRELRPETWNGNIMEHRFQMRWNTNHI